MPKPELGIDQRVHDFQTLVAMFAKRCAPYEWKKQAFGFDLFEVKPYLDRVRAAKDDLEFYEIQAEYVAAMRDSHSSFFMTSSVSANLGITIDIYDGKVLIDSINRTLLPQARFPFAIGDEVVSVDGVPAEDLIARFARFRAYGNPVATRRNAAGRIAVRTQSGFPRAVELGESATVVVRGPEGSETTHVLPWTKWGLPVFNAGPVPMPKYAARKSASADPADALAEFHQYKLPDDDPLAQPVGWGSDTSADEPRKFILGQGSRAPVHGELPNLLNTVACEVLLRLPGCATSSSCSFI